MAIERGTKQILPALRFIQKEQQQQHQHHQQQQQQRVPSSSVTAAMGSYPGSSAAYGDNDSNSNINNNMDENRTRQDENNSNSNGSSPGSSTRPIPPPPVADVAGTLTQRVTKLLDMLEPPNDFPSLRVENPKVGTRLLGDVVPVVAHVGLGTAIEARLAEGEQEQRKHNNNDNDDGNNKDSNGDDNILTQLNEANAQIKATPTTSTATPTANHKHHTTTSTARTTPLSGGPPLSYCEVHIFIDDALAHTIPVSRTAHSPP
ncbi:unnamed protein product, partial [Sphacelaria rigidula]